MLDFSVNYYPKNRAAWRKWLEKNHANSTGVWLVYYKKESGKPRVEYADAVEEALCFGWIDSTMRPRDENSYMQLFTPRKPKSNWSKLNKSRIERLIADGLMTDAGMAKIEAAKKDGTWTIIDSVEALEVPLVLEQAFKANKKARKFFDGLSNTGKKYILYYINGAKRDETKEKRVAEIIAAANEGKMLDRFAAPAAKKSK